MCHEHYLSSDLHFLIVVWAESLNNIEKLRKLFFARMFSQKSHTKHYFQFDPHLVIEHGHKVEIIMKNKEYRYSTTCLYSIIMNTMVTITSYIVL